MTIFQHLVPGNTIGITPPLNPVQGAFVVHDVSRAIYAQTSASPIAPPMVGYIPATTDGNGGIQQLARSLDAQYYPQTVSGFSASIVGTTLTIAYPNVPALWNGIIQTLEAGSISATVTTGKYSLVVGYMWGLTQVQILLTSALSPTGSYVELCEVAVNTTTVTVNTTNGMVNSKFIQTLCVAGPVGSSFGIPVSGSNEVLTW